MGLATRYTLQRNTASIMKIWFDFGIFIHNLRKRRSAKRARLEDAGHLSTNLDGVIPLSVFLSGIAGELESLLNTVPLVLNI